MDIWISGVIMRWYGDIIRFFDDKGKELLRRNFSVKYLGLAVDYKNFNDKEFDVSGFDFLMLYVEEDSNHLSKIKKSKKLLDKISIDAKGIVLFSQKYEVLRNAVDKHLVDAIVDLPLSFEMFNIDEVLIKKAAENNVSLIFNFKTFTSLSRQLKVKYLRNMRKILQIACKKDVKVLVGSFAENFYELRKPRDLSSFLYVTYRNLGFSLKGSSNNYYWFYDFLKKMNMKERIYPGYYVFKGEENAQTDIKR